MNSSMTYIIDILEQRTDLQSLFPKQTWNSELEQKIEDLKHHGSGTEWITLIAALHLRNDNLALSHPYAQQIEHDPTGAYWHGIMHRMEEDYSNAKYWFWQAGHHPVKQQVRQEVAKYLSEANLRSNSEVMNAFKQEGWTSDRFCDLVKMSSKFDEHTINMLKKIQAIEIEVLFAYTLAALEV